MDPSGPGTDETMAAPVSSDDDTMAAPDLDASGARRSAAGRGLPEKVGRYEILSRLGAGGMGVVYKARDPELAREVAIKLLRTDRGGGDMARLQREAQAMARVQHANLVTVFDVGRAGDEVFIAMEYVRGQTLREWLGGETRDRAEILEAFLDAGQGLVAAHQAGIVHRDFKPDNVLVSRKGEVKVLDFGLAVGSTQEDSPAGPPSPDLSDGDPMSLRLTQTGALLGTPAYMSPEQFRSEPTDARTDQFSFAVALFEALAGRRPFPSTTMGELVASVTDGLVALPSDESLGPLKRPLLRALSPNREDRWPDLATFLGELQQSVEQAADAAPKRGLPAWALYGAGGLAVAGLAGVFVMSSDILDRQPPDPPAYDGQPKSDIEVDLLAMLAIEDPEARRERADFLQVTYGDSVLPWARLILEAELAAATWKRGCPEPGPLGLCVREVALDGERCWPDPIGYEAAGRDPETAKWAGERLQEANAFVVGVMPNHPDLLLATQEAQSRMAVLAVDVELEALLLRRPSGVGKAGPSGGDFGSEFAKDSAALAQTYADLAEAAQRPRWAVAALARMGLAHEAYPKALISNPVPSTPEQEDERKVHCAATLEAGRPSLELASETYAACRERAEGELVGVADANWCRDRSAVTQQRFEFTNIPPATVIDGELTAQQIRTVLRSEVNDIRACYNEALQSDSSLTGRLAIAMEVSAEGNLRGVRVRGSELPEKLTTCIAGDAMTWEFPASESGEGTKAVFPLILSPG